VSSERAMNIKFTNKTKHLNEMKKTVREHGYENAKKIKQCFSLIASSPNLQSFFNEHFCRCHLLRGDLKDCYGLDIKHPFRIVIKPTNAPIPLKANNEIDTLQVTEVEVVLIGDYHE
jgi:proteic killer suppression protein